MEEKDFLKKVGKNLKVERIKKDLSQEKLAECIDSNQQYISLIESGEQNTTLSNLFKLSQVLEIEPYKLLKFDE